MKLTLMFPLDLIWCLPPDSLSQLSTADSSPQEEVVSVGHSFKYGEDVDKSYHEINVNSEKRINLDNV